jgi:hypothetical protein
MADHADQPRSALTEWPLWIWWRVMTTLAPLYRLAVGWRDRDQEEGPLNRRLAVATAVLAVVAFALGVFVVALLV